MGIDIPAAQEFLRSHHHAVLATTRTDSRPQLSPVTAAVDDAGRVLISTREPALKVRHLRRDPRAAMVVLPDGFFGEWVQVEGTAEIIALPEAMDLLIDYYRRASGEHPDWDDYRQAMIDQRRVVIRITIERAGPNVSG
jgi:PPOX class probable F420-dependent enzyme